MNTYSPGRQGFGRGLVYFPQSAAREPSYAEASPMAFFPGNLASQSAVPRLPCHQYHDQLPQHHLPQHFLPPQAHRSAPMQSQFPGYGLLRSSGGGLSPAFEQFNNRPTGPLQRSGMHPSPFWHRSLIDQPRTAQGFATHDPPFLSDFNSPNFALQSAGHAFTQPFAVNSTASQQSYHSPIRQPLANGFHYAPPNPQAEQLAQYAPMYQLDQPRQAAQGYAPTQSAQPGLMDQLKWPEFYKDFPDFAVQATADEVNAAQTSMFGNDSLTSVSGLGYLGPMANTSFQPLTDMDLGNFEDMSASQDFGNQDLPNMFFGHPQSAPVEMPFGQNEWFNNPAWALPVDTDKRWVTMETDGLTAKPNVSQTSNILPPVVVPPSLPDTCSSTQGRAVRDAVRDTDIMESIETDDFPASDDLDKGVSCSSSEVSEKYGSTCKDSEAAEEGGSRYGDFENADDGSGSEVSCEGQDCKVSGGSGEHSLSPGFENTLPSEPEDESPEPETRGVKRALSQDSSQDDAPVAYVLPMRPIAQPRRPVAQMPSPASDNATQTTIPAQISLFSTTDADGSATPEQPPAKRTRLAGDGPSDLLGVQRRSTDLAAEARAKAAALCATMPDPFTVAPRTASYEAKKAAAVMLSRMLDFGKIHPRDQVGPRAREPMLLQPARFQPTRFLTEQELKHRFESLSRTTQLRAAMPIQQPEIVPLSSAFGLSNYLGPWRPV